MEEEHVENNNETNPQKQQELKFDVDQWVLEIEEQLNLHLESDDQESFDECVDQILEAAKMTEK